MIIAMKKAVLVALKADKEPLLESLQRYGEMMLIPPTGDLSGEGDTSVEEGILQRTEKSLALVRKYREKKKMGEQFAVDYRDFLQEDPRREALLGEIENASDEIGIRHQEIAALKERIALLRPWESLEGLLSELSQSKEASVKTGFVENRNFEAFAALISDLGGEMQSYGKVDNGTAVLIACFRADEDEMAEKAKTLGFVEIVLPPENHSAKDLLASLEAQKGSHVARIETLEAKLRECARQTDEIGVLADQTATTLKRKKASLTETLETVYLEGWVRSDRLPRFEKAVKSVTDIYDLEYLDPADGEKPPTVTKNNKFVDAFETVTDMFSKPDPYELDPNPVMSVWYWLIFGMMMGDAGYGVVMLLVIGLMIKKMKPKGNALRLLRVLFYTGFSTILWGIVFGSFFGYTVYFGIFPLIEPMAEPIPLLVLCVVMGLMHLFTGLLMKAWGNLKKKDYMAVYADSVAWMMLLGGLGMLFLPAPAPAIGKWVAIAGAASIVLFAGRAVRKIPGRVGLGLYSLYGASSYLGDILSYSRILALAMSSAALAMVMNLLVGMLSNGVFGTIMGILVFFIGHVFNLAMGLLSAYVHASRLQYIEFFGKFFSGGGLTFRPLNLQLKHIDVVNDHIN